MSDCTKCRYGHYCKEYDIYGRYENYKRLYCTLGYCHIDGYDEDCFAFESYEVDH